MLYPLINILLNNVIRYYAIGFNTDHTTMILKFTLVVFINEFKSQL